MILTGDIYNLDQLPPGSIANLVAEPGELAAAAESLLDRVGTHPRTVTAAQRLLFDGPGNQRAALRGHWLHLLEHLQEHLIGDYPHAQVACLPRLP